MTIRWTPTALRDMESLHAYISTYRPDAANEMVEQILAGINSLERNPQMGRPGRVPGSRELVVRPYIVAYRLKGGGIELLAIMHGAQRWPDSF